MKVEFFKGLTDISKRRNLDRKICNNLKLLSLKIQKNQKYQLLQKLQTLNVLNVLNMPKDPSLACWALF